MPRGRYADHPSKMNRKAWKDILHRIKDEINNDHIMIIGAGAAFYSFLALIPGLTALVSIYGLIADPAMVSDHIKRLGGIVPPEMQQLIEEQLTRIVESSDTALSVGMVIALLISLWSASSGMKGIIEALNIAYGEEEKRGFIQLTLLSLGMSLAAIFFFILLFSAIVAIPKLLEVYNISPVADILLQVAQWIVLGALVSLSLATLYRFAPSRDRAEWKWLSWGAIFATIVWIFASVGFSIYTQNFGNYNATYGSLGAVVILLLWLYISVVVILIGAELNSEIEHQTRVDTTLGQDEPMGTRGATVADTLGESNTE